MTVCVFILGVDGVGNRKDGTFRKFFFQLSSGFCLFGPLLFCFCPLCFRVRTSLFRFRPFLLCLRLLGFCIRPVSLSLRVLRL